MINHEHTGWCACGFIFFVAHSCFVCCSFRGQTALHKAALYERRTICSLLVQAGASLTRTDYDVSYRFKLTPCTTHSETNQYLISHQFLGIFWLINLMRCGNCLPQNDTFLCYYKNTEAAVRNENNARMIKAGWIKANNKYTGCEKFGLSLSRCIDQVFS